MAAHQFGIFLVITAFAFVLSQKSSAHNPDLKPAVEISEGDWTLVLEDEFDGEALDGNIWTTCYWWNDGGCTNLGNKELQWYRPANVSVSEGMLHLTARPETVRGYRGRTYRYTSGMVTSGNYHSELPRPPRFEFQYGLVEVRARAPKGKGLWSALWLLPSDHGTHPEIDIMEILGDSTDRLRMHFHYLDDADRPRNKGHTTATSDLTEDWQVYGVRWEPDYIAWYLNGVEVWRYTDADRIPHHKMYLLMNLAVGGKWPGPPNESTTFPATFHIDYVRIWQRVS